MPGPHAMVGILGGMGPAATVDLMHRVIERTPARDDGDHIHMLVDCNPKVPSRIKALIEGTGENPVPALAAMIRRLEAAGASMLAMPCNTAHAYLPEIRAVATVPFLDMIGLTASEIAQRSPRPRSVGLLASTAVIDLGLYADVLHRAGIGVEVPAEQDKLMAIIVAVKRGEIGEGIVGRFLDIAAELSGRCDLLLIACTELSILAGQIETGRTVVDALDVLANAIVATALSASEV